MNDDLQRGRGRVANLQREADETAAALEQAQREQQEVSKVRPELHTTVAPVTFGKQLLNNVLSFDHAQLHK